MYTWIFTFLTVSGAIFNAKKRIEGFYIWIVANVCWFTHNLIIKEYAQAAVFIALTVVTVYGIRQWRKEKKNGS